jgi:drug/metabolite transporter (DMT)-like permease
MSLTSYESTSIGVTLSLLIGSVALGAVGDVLIFHWAKTNYTSYLSTGLLVWVASLMLMGYLFRYATLSLGVVVVLMILLHLMIDVSWDTFVFGHRLTNLQCCGVVLAVVAIVLLSFGKLSSAT